MAIGSTKKMKKHAMEGLLLRRAFDPIFGALLFLQWPFSLHMFVFMLPWIFCLRNFSLWQFRVPNVGSIYS